MRIVREINHYPCKITLLEYGGRYSLKFEDNFSAITLKLKMVDSNTTPDDIIAVINQTLVQKVMQQLGNCNELSLHFFHMSKSWNAPDEDDII